MLFSGIPFLYYFLPITLSLYFLAPRRLKNAVLLLCSLVFYGWGEPVYIVVMLISVTVAYACGFADQSHMIREFRQFTGYTPAQYLVACAPVSDYFSQP